MGITGITGQAIEYALDGLSMRHAAIAANIANANTPNYRPVRVSFESQLASTLSQWRGGSSTLTPGSPTVSVVQNMTSGLRTGALENEVVLLNKNTLQYEALIKGLDKYAAIVSTAINEGRR